jgi:hypothetical protein
METKEHNKQWHLVRNNNGEWISEEYAEFLTPLEVGILQVKAAQQGIQLDVQHGADGQLWCYKHQLEAIKIEPINKTFMKRELRIKKKSLSSYLGRGLHSDKWDNAFGEDGKLGGLIEMVKKDDELVLQIREDYFNVYYKGGNMLKVSSENSFQFDYNYYKCEIDLDTQEQRNKRIDKRRSVLESLKKTRDYKTFIAEMKKLMDEYWIWLYNEKHRSLHEKDTQHALCISNTESTDYTIIDLEFQVSTRNNCIYHYEPSSIPRHPGVDVYEKSPRFDIIAVRNIDHRLCVIELKNGLDALTGKSGIGDHADSFEGSIGKNPLAEFAFTKEMKKLVSDKKHLELLSDDFYIDEKLPIEFIYAYAFNSKDENGKEAERKSFIREQEKACCMNYKVIYLNKGDFTLSDSNY